MKGASADCECICSEAFKGFKRHSLSYELWDLGVFFLRSSVSSPVFCPDFNGLGVSVLSPKLMD